MKTKEELLELAAEYFNEELTVLYGTSDGNIFYKENDAKTHARHSELECYTLEAETEVEPETETEVEPETETEPETEASTKKTKKSKAE